jgi:Flp pilus assembly protein CpaB
MRRGRIFIYLALIVILGVAAFFLLSKGNLLGKKGTEAGVQGTPGVVATAIPIDRVDVVISKQDIPRGVPITEEHLDKKTIPQDMYDQGMFKYPDELNKVVGRKAVSTIKQNRIIMTGDLIDTQTLLTGRQEALLIPAQKVAVSIPISRLSSSGYAPQAGDHVNVIVTLLFLEYDTDFQSKLPNYTAAVIAPGPNLILWQSSTGTGEDAENVSALNSAERMQNITAQVASGGAVSMLGRSLQDTTLDQTLYLVPSEAQRPRLVSQSLIQDVLVLHMGNFEYEETVEPVTVAEGEPTPTPVPQTLTKAPDLITLVVSPQDAVTLNYLIYSGAKLTLALRPPNDSSVAQIQAVTLDYLVNSYQIAFPVKLHFGIEPRVDELVEPELEQDAVPTPVR